jgi:hypothetical protein
MRLWSWLSGFWTRKPGSGTLIDVMRMGFTKEHLLKMTEQERGAFLLFGYTSNQVNVLWKVIIASLNRDPPDPVDARVSAAQSQILVRQIVGILWEAWRAVETHFLKSKLGKEYEPLLDPEARKALDGLKKFFGKKNEIELLRNTFSFHHPDIAEMEAGFRNAANSKEVADDEWAIYLSSGLMNCFFFMSDMVIAHGMTEALGHTDVNEAHRVLLPKLGPVANQLSDFTYGFAAAIFRKYVGDEMVLTVVSKLEGAPHVDEVKLPFFMEMEPKKGGILYPHLPEEAKRSDVK